MPAPRLIVAELDGTRIGEWFPLSELTMDVDRARPGTLSTTVEPRGTRPEHPVAIYVVTPDQQGVPQVYWSGIVWRVTPAATAGEPWDIEAATFDSLWTQATLRTSQTWTQVDQATIVKDLVTMGLGATEAARWLLDMPPTGILRDYTVEGVKAPSLYKAVFDLADNINGYDIAIEGAAEGVKHRQAHMLFPRDHREQTTVAIRPGVAITRWDDDWTWVANIVTATGDNDMIYTEARPALPGWPDMARQISYSGVVIYETLVEKAQHFLDKHSVPLISAEVEAATGESMIRRIGEDVRVIDSDRHRDAVFQLVTVGAKWVGESRVETWTLTQEDTGD